MRRLLAAAVLLLVFLAISRAEALPTFDNKCEGSGNFTNNASCSITVGGLTNGILLLAVATTGGDTSVNTLTVGGVATNIVSGPTFNFDTGGAIIRTYYKLAPAPGPLLLEVTTTNSVQGVSIAGASFGGVSQSTPTGATAAIGAESTTVSNAITGTAVDLIVQWVAWQTAGGQRALTSFGASQTSHINDEGGVAGVALSSKVAAGATTMTGTLSQATSHAEAAFLLISSAPDTTPPTAPTNFTVAAAGTTQTNGSWTASTDDITVCRYRYERCPGAACANFVEIDTTTVNSFQDTGLTSGTLYRYRVRADDCTNLGSYSTIAEVTTLTPQNVDILFDDQQPDGLNAETGFKIYCKAGPSGTYTLVTTTSPSAGSGATVTYNYTQAPAPTVCCQVVATNTGGDSSPLGGDAGVCFTNDTPPGPASLFVSPPSLGFSATVGGADPASQALTISNIGESAMSWTVADDVIWLQVTPSSGTDTTVTTVSVSLAGLTAGVYNATITVTAPGAVGTPATIPVTLSLQPQATPAHSRGGRVR